ncbi:protease modulator HflC [bacterium]|nr:protease modulator HflC [bacterium]
MNKPKIRRIIILFCVIAALSLFYLFFTTVVYEGEMAVVTRFGKPVRVLDKPGFYLRLPFPLNHIGRIDSRLTMLEPRPSEYLTADKKNLILESSICYRISEPIVFLKTVIDQEGLNIRLTDLLSSHTGLLLSIHELSEIINVEAAKLKFQELNDKLTELIRKDASSFGISVEQVFVKRVMLPDDNKRAVYKRMSAERERIAKKYLAEGEEKALEIRAEADKEYRRILAEAQSEATIKRGKADAEAMEIYGEAYSKNTQFYNYIRTLEAYEDIFGEKTTIILDENSKLLKIFFSGGN